MSEHNDGKNPDSRRSVTTNRMIIGVLVGGLGLYLIGSGLAGIPTK